jgi:uncharacterized protein (DUF1499 family)
MNLHFYSRHALMFSWVLLVGACSSAPDKPAEMQALPECGALTNCVNTQPGYGLQASEPVRGNARQWQSLKAWVTREDNREITVDDDVFIQAVVKTPFLGSRDDVQMLYLPDAQLDQVRSPSRLGLNDLGANARRVETLREQLFP